MSSQTTSSNLNAPPPEWETEGDLRSFESDGFHCCIVRNPEIKSLCGYVLLPPSHPDHGNHYDELRGIPVHQAWTFSESFLKCCGNAWGQEFLLEQIQADPERVTLLQYHVVGFDCAHVGADFVPAEANVISEFTGRPTTYRNMAFVEGRLRAATLKFWYDANKNNDEFWNKEQDAESKLQAAAAKIEQSLHEIEEWEAAQRPEFTDEYYKEMFRTVSELLLLRREMANDDDDEETKE